MQIGLTISPWARVASPADKALRAEISALSRERQSDQQLLAALLSLAARIGKLTRSTIR